MTTRADEIADRAAFLARTYGIKTDIANGHRMYSLVDNAPRHQRMCIISTSDGGLTVRIGDHRAFHYWPESDLNEVSSIWADELERRLGLTVEEVSI